MFAIAIDGPAGAGKSSIAKAMAQKLNFIYVDTGALYRTVAVHLLDNNIDPGNIAEVEGALADIVVTMEHEEDGQHVFLNNKDVTKRIRTPEVSMAASTSSAIPAVRNFLFSLQKGMAERYNVIMDGRDIGTVVLPKAQVKIFLTASPEERARRRTLEFEAKGEKADFEEILEDVKKRDYQDSHREIAPLKPAEDGIIVDSSNLSFNEVVETLINIVKEKM